MDLDKRGVTKALLEWTHQSILLQNPFMFSTVESRIWPETISMLRFAMRLRDLTPSAVEKLHKAFVGA